MQTGRCVCLLRIGATHVGSDFGEQGRVEPDRVEDFLHSPLPVGPAVGELTSSLPLPGGGGEIVDIATDSPMLLRQTVADRPHKPGGSSEGVLVNLNRHVRATTQPYDAQSRKANYPQANVGQRAAITRERPFPDERFSLTQVADAVGVSSATVMREVDRLVDAGLVRTSRAGNQRLVQADTSTVVYRPLADLLAVTFGPRPVLAEILSRVPDIERAFIYGSWAARYHQQPGAVPGDLDVLVIGQPSRRVLDDAIEGMLEDARGIVEVMRKLLPHVGPFR